MEGSVYTRTARGCKANAWPGADDGNGTGTRAAIWGWPALVTAAVAQGDRARQALSSEGGGKAFGTLTEDEASLLPLNKALKGSRRATRQFRYNSEICI